MAMNYNDVPETAFSVFESPVPKPSVSRAKNKNAYTVPLFVEQYKVFDDIDQQEINKWIVTMQSICKSKDLKLCLEKPIAMADSAGYFNKIAISYMITGNNRIVSETEFPRFDEIMYFEIPTETWNEYYVRADTLIGDI